MQMRLLAGDVCLHKSTVHDDVISESAGPLIQLWYDTMVRDSLKMGIIHGQIWLRIITQADEKTVITETVLQRSNTITYNAIHIELYRIHLHQTKQVYAPQ
jgi:hypothetical protein